MIKKIIFPIFSLFSLVTQATELKTFPEVAQAVSQGTELVFVTSLKACKAEFPLSDITVSMKPNALMLIGDKRVTASDKHFTLDEPGYSGLPVIDYAKFNISAEGGAELIMTVMDAKDYSVLAKHQIECELGLGLRVYD